MLIISNYRLYIYFRYDARQTIMVITNIGGKTVKPDWTAYAERTKDFSQVRNVISGKIKPLNGLEVEPKESFVLELIR